MNLPMSDEISYMEIEKSGDYITTTITDKETINEIYGHLEDIKNAPAAPDIVSSGCCSWTYTLEFFNVSGERVSKLLINMPHAYGVGAGDVYNLGATYYKIDEDYVLSLSEVIEKAFLDNRTFEAPLACNDTYSNNIEMSDEDAKKILDIFTNNTWTFCEEDVDGLSSMDYWFTVKSGARVLYDKDLGWLTDSYGYRMKLSNEDKAIINNILGIEE